MSLNLAVAPYQGLLLVAFFVSLMPLLGATVSLLLFSRTSLGSKKKPLAYFAAYLMVVLALYLFALDTVHTKLTNVASSELAGPFLIGFALMALIMTVHNFFSRHEEHIHVGFFLFAMTLMHEVVEAASLSDIFYSVSRETVNLLAPLVSIGVLALHEYPEGMLLIIPFLLAGRRRLGLSVLFFNQFVFIASAVFFFFVVGEVEPGGQKEALLHLLPAGGILALGVFELRRAWRIKEETPKREVFTKLTLGAVSLFVLSGLTGALLVSTHTVDTKLQPRSSGTEISPITGEEIPIYYADPCEHEVDFPNCLED